MKLDFSSRMTRLCLGGVQIRSLEGVYLKVSKLKFLTNATDSFQIQVGVQNQQNL